MSIGSVIGGTLRTLVIAAATGAAAFGLLVVFQPFGKTTPAVAVTVSGSPEATALQVRIETLRVALRDSEAALDAAPVTSTAASPDAADTARLVGQARGEYRPGTSLLFVPADGPDPWLAGKVETIEGMGPVDGRAAAYVCENFICQRPVTDLDGDV